MQRRSATRDPENAVPSLGIAELVVLAMVVGIVAVVGLVFVRVGRGSNSNGDP